MKKGLITLSADSAKYYYQELPTTIVFLDTWMLSYDCWQCGNKISISNPFNMNSKNEETLSFRDYGALTSKRISNLDVIHSQLNAVVKEIVNEIDCLFQKNLSDNTSGPLTNCASFHCPHCNAKYLMLYYHRLREEYRSPESRMDNSITILELVTGDDIQFPVLK